MPLSKRPLHVAACAKTETDIEVRQVMLSARHAYQGISSDFCGRPAG